jgi:hypothetical protein
MDGSGSSMQANYGGNMTERKKLDRGSGITYSTRIVGQKTYLLIEPWFDEKNMSGNTTCAWHIELCNQPTHDEQIKPDDSTKRIDISGAAGALVSVRNSGGWPFYAWTDYG